jgi:AcrR family transcriptional regulator
VTKAQPESAGKQRILDAALTLYAERGPDAVTMRDIAAAAEVSPALVVHHFGSNAGLRAEVNAHVIGLFERLRDTALVHVASATSDPTKVGSIAAGILQQLPPGSPIPGYLRYLLFSGDPVGVQLFSTWVDVGRGVMRFLIDDGIARPTEDVDARVAFMVAFDFALLTLHQHIYEAIGTDSVTPEGLHRMVGAALEVYSRGIFVAPPSP